MFVYVCMQLCVLDERINVITPRLCGHAIIMTHQMPLSILQLLLPHAPTPTLHLLRPIKNALWYADICCLTFRMNEVLGGGGRINILKNYGSFETGTGEKY